MTIKEILKLSNREFTAYRTRSVATVIAVGTLFGLLLAVLFVAQGLENVVLKYAGDATDGAVYLASGYSDTQLVIDRIYKFGGEIVELSEQQKTKPEAGGLESLIIAKFNSISRAYQYNMMLDADELHYSPRQYHVEELFGNQIKVYHFFKEKKQDFVIPIGGVLLVVSVFILALTMAHLIASNTKTFALYRSIGASKGQILLVYFVYLLELCAWAAIFAVGLGVLLAGVATGIGWNYLLAQLTEYYPGISEFWPILVGVNWQCAGVILVIFASAPIAFLLCLDQLSSGRLTQKLKGD